MDKYSILLSSLELGQQERQISIKKSLFENYSETEIKDANLTANLLIYKDTRQIKIEFDIKGTLNVPCDRCLNYMDLEISCNEELFVEFGSENSDLSDADQKIIISGSEEILDLSKHLYDYILLCIPYKKVHGEDDNGVSLCNSEMIDILAGYNETNEKTDPRWDILKQLKN